MMAQMFYFIWMRGKIREGKDGGRKKLDKR